MSTRVVLVHHWLPDGELARWQSEFTGCEFVDGRDPVFAAQHLPRAEVCYGLPDCQQLAEAPGVKWIQLASAGVPAALCSVGRKQAIHVTNLAGLYGPTIAEHALAMMLILSRNLQVAHGNQAAKKWDRSVAGTMRDLHGRTLAVVGLGNIGQNIARLAKAFGMRVVGCRRTPRPTPFTDQVYARDELAAMLREADYVAVAAPLTAATEGMLGSAEIDAVKQGAIYVNVSRGPIAQEAALLAALRSGRVRAAGLDVFAVEPLADNHPFWSMPNVLVSPHYSGETTNNSDLPAQRFRRNLRNYLGGRDLEGLVRLELGY